MQYRISIKLLFLFFFCSFFSLPLGYTEAIYNPPPVEKVKPAEKQHKKKKIHSKKIKKRHNPNAKMDKASPLLMGILSIASFVIFIGGAVLFGFGLAILLMWVIGISMMGLANLFPWLLLLTGNSEDEAINKNLGTAFPVFLILNFLGGLIFLIYGFAIALSLFWIVGIVLLALAALIFIFWFLLRK